jgi:hypothetical protein
MVEENLEEKSESKEVKEPKKGGHLKKIAIGAVAVCSLGFLALTHFDLKYKPRVHYWGGEVQISKGYTKNNRFFYAAREDGTEMLEEWHKNKYFCFEDENGDGEINRVRIYLPDYRGGKDVILIDEGKEWGEIGKTEIANKRKKYREHIPFLRILDKIEEESD